MASRLSAVAFLLLVVGCGPKTSLPEAEIPSIPGRPDAGPALEHHHGLISARTLEPVELTAVARLVSGDHIYVRAIQPGEAESQYDGSDQFLTLPRDVRGVAFRKRSWGSPLELWLRYQKGLAGRDRIRVRQATSPGYHDDASSGVLQHLVVTGIKSAKTDPTLRAGFLMVAGGSIKEHGERSQAQEDPFFAFARERLRVMAEGGTERWRALNPTRGRRVDVGDTMALYTGWTSVEESLQADRGLLLRGAERSERTIPIASLEGVPLAEHPWPQMIAELPGEPRMEPLAAYVPNDVIYLHFHDLRTLVSLVKDIDDWASPLVQIIDSKPGATHFAERYEEQLALERLGFAETLGHAAANGVALVASDPFFREGTDVSILFDVRSKALLDAALKEYEKRFREKRPDATVSHYDVRGTRVRLFGTADKRVHQHRVQIENVLIISNSKSAVERFIAVRKGELRALRDSGDFQYMRAVYPFDREKEDGFAFAGDALVANVVGPRTKILSSRRMQARADLAAVNYATLLYGWMEGAPADDLGQVIRAGYLDEAELKHPDGAEIHFDMARGASSKWGTVARLEPLLDLDVGTVTREEKEAYERFRDTYQDYWRGFIDPIAARVRRSESGRSLEIDARMLPLIESTEYNELVRMVGKQTVTSPPRADGIQWTLAVGANAELRREVDGLARGITGSDRISVGWLGDWVMVGAGDRSGLWDLALWGAEIPDTRARSAIREEATNKQTEIMSRLPLYAGAHVRDRFALAVTLTALKGYAQTAAPGLVEWVADQPYRGVLITVVRETAMPDRSPEFGVAIRYAIVQDVIVVALERETLESQIDALLDGRLTTRAGDADVQGASQSIVSVRTSGGDSWLTRTLAGVMEQATLSANRGTFRSMEILTRGLGGIPRDLYATGLGYLGYEPRFANGGTFELGQDGLLVHSIYGTEVEPRLPALPVPDAAVTELLGRLQRLEMGIGFEGEGNHRGLHARLRIDRR